MSHNYNIYHATMLNSDGKISYSTVAFKLRDKVIRYHESSYSK